MKDLKSQYEALKPRYDSLVTEVRFALERVLQSANLKVAGISGRVKTFESLEEKIERKSYADPLAEVADFAGVRVVCLFTDDIEVVRKLITDLFEVIEVTDKTALLGTSLMGYAGCHFVVILGEKHKGSRYDGISGLKCEIQVRTILQDAWAQIDHFLMYKSEASIPEKERRELKNVSALLEVAQSIFDRSRETRLRYSEEVAAKQSKPDEFLFQPIDRETVAAFTRSRYPSLPVNDKLQEMMLKQLDRDRYKTLRDIEVVRVAAEEAVAAYKRAAPELFKSGTDHLTKSLGFVDANFRHVHGFAKRTRDAFQQHSSLVRSEQGGT